MKLAPDNHRVSAGELLKRFSRSEVKWRGHSVPRCTFPAKRHLSTYDPLSVRCPSANTYFTRRDIFVFSGGISMKPGTNIHRLSKYCRKSFIRSEVKGQGRR